MADLSSRLLNCRYAILPSRQIRRIPLRFVRLAIHFQAVSLTPRRHSRFRLEIAHLADLTHTRERPSVLVVTIWNGGHSNGVGIVVEELAHGVADEGARCVVLHLVPDGPMRPATIRDASGAAIVQLCVRPRPSLSRPLHLPGYLLRLGIAGRTIPPSCA